MKAAILGEAGIEIGEVPKPVPKPNEVLIRVRATTLNRADLLVASGHQHGAVGGKGARIGLECAGEVEAVGSEVEGLKPGDRVMGSAPGAHAQYVVTDYVRLHRIPAQQHDASPRPRAFRSRCRPCTTRSSPPAASSAARAC